MSAILTNDQKRYLAQLSDRAFNLLAAQSRARGEDPAASIAATLNAQLSARGSSLAAILPSAICHLPFSELSATDQRQAFRHAHVILATGRHGLRCCTQDDYGSIKGHFLNLLGEPGRALKVMVHGDPALNRRRIAEYKLVEACNQAGVRLSYAEAICRSQNHGAILADIDAQAIWRLVYTVRTRSRSRKHQQAA